MTPNWQSIPPKARIELYVDKSQCVLGEQVKGVVRIFSEEEFDVNQAIVCLTCREDVKRTRIGGIQDGVLIPFTQVDYWDSSIIYGTSYPLFAGVRIPCGYNSAFDYTLIISPGAKETQYGIDHTVRWFMYAILESRCRPNVQTMTYEIQVARPQISQTPTIMKEVTREVVLITCSYCSGLMPHTSVFCPNCGARRKS
jgi:hypothetical protein